ncbi:bifunctional adenosylcobinamide kinase/adenosylcobinamide-phosphate guanylyltransferase [Paracoccus sp. 1_MG-2023]|uniref:bifunctional adenosylcobinamide kinase/adenosylcobinamide-phosphate guanylyltransferase n=1 Tax=unclassified Paracoccus (in: a-proteobacteria) TaxID=2688777 RepID=UPI001C09C474|nr:MULTISPECIES: bifunctional adenosylcobinamide kinase/adenosylcobinamide-phosphate guanylyltransferase [unclassified Paracoccus (in: a-proteobacteria)]MBU2958820.1 bifunctional adenosylcobinamide kinase/adenosylcobinamide-phosphate guanylyltransferase [Paracoccus sp. C2R09]MDO6670049.1 bifunctional adenosylcobinamide kinase/adenosylcobinamide-phosphate guanylyltransferase [Paracoccus sp. 1_MG-2023]
MTQNGHITLVTGGARSGKSVLAERLIGRHPGRPIYIATAEPRDGEMSERIVQHQSRRGETWDLHEEPRALARALRATDGQGPRLVDCLTLWLANCEGSADFGALAATLRQQCCPVVIVTNELGQGIVPDNALARRFRDDHGRMNQIVAELAHEVWMSVSGQPLRLKPGRDPIDEPI